ncbi:MAG: glycosyltransferase [Clostridiales bacterium]|nr:glycosyltransferase [Clostridiales bacterium]
MEKPVLSIGIIFKNEIRCLDRCLKSLQPLRDALPCELVMADTGSGDGSREVAERYADILFDFPWINDFAAARNAVMDRCSGQWYFSIDADEWLDQDISELTSFLRNRGNYIVDTAVVVVRNYNSREPGSEYVDFQGIRLARMAANLRYEGAIHEVWPAGRTEMILHHTILHHDGYAYANQEERKKKEQRNMELLRRKLEEEPESVRTLLVCIESSELQPDLVDYARRGVAAVAQKAPGWVEFGPFLLQRAVRVAQIKCLPELDEWVAMAQEWFPDSPATRIDIAFVVAADAWNKEDYLQCIRWGEGYLKAIQEDAEQKSGHNERLYDSIMTECPSCQRHMRILLAGSYLRTGGTERAAELLGKLDGAEMDAEQTRNFILLLQELHAKTLLDTASLITSFWEHISVSEPTPQRVSERKAAFYRTAQGAFHPDGLKEEENCRSAHTLYLPLRDQCDLGRAAAILETGDLAEMEALLSQVEHWDILPIQALSHALECGVSFPLTEKPLNIEEMDGLAARLSQDRSSFFSLAGPALSGLLFQWGQDLAWARAIALTAVQVYSWDADAQDSEQGLALARAFAEAEERFLPCCYAPEALRENGLYMLPPMHRFGWWCSKAFDALDAGDAAGYTRCLREGLNTCGAMRPMVEFLMEHTPELQAPAPSSELRALAAQIRTILSAYPADDPAVAALKQSEAYQKVAYLIEGLEPPVMGGQLQ